MYLYIKINENCINGDPGVPWVGFLGALSLGDPWALGTLGPWGPLGLGDPEASGSLGPWGLMGLGDPWALGTLGLGDLGASPYSVRGNRPDSKGVPLP